MPTDSNTSQQSVAQEIYKRNRELLQERRHAEELLYNVSEGVLAVDKDYTITIFDNALEKMLNLPQNAALGKKLFQVINIETEAGEKIELEQYCFIPEQKMPVLSHVVLNGGVKRFFVNVKFSPIKSDVNPEESECLITIADITDEIMLDKAKDDFLSLASHELKSPLTVIKSYLWVLQSKMRTKLSGKQKEYVDVAYRGTEQMIALVNDMLNISRLEQGKLDFDIHPGKIIKSIREAISPLDLQVKENNIYLRVDKVGCDDDLDAYYDEGKLKECVVNLVGNAIKFTKEGGITIKIENGEPNVRISVIDTGVGIAEEDVPKLFSKFGKGENSYKKVAKTGGTGLGLYIVKLFAEKMGGTVGYSSPGNFKGSVFWFTVPRHTIIHN